MLTLDLAICTHRPEGIRRVEKMLLPPVEGMRYIVSWQGHQDAAVPECIRQREDVVVLRYEGKGLSGNRNNALDHCTADLALFADDDIILNLKGISELRRYMEEHREVDVVTLKSVHADMDRFPSVEADLNGGYPKGYSVASFEIAVRRSTAGRLRLCPELGLGAERLWGGEDEAFLLSAIHRGLRCRFVPIEICAHPGESTGTKSRLNNENLLAMGCVSHLTYPATSFLRLPLKAWRLWRAGQAGFFRALYYLCGGAMASRGLRMRNPDTLW